MMCNALNWKSNNANVDNPVNLDIYFHLYNIKIYDINDLFWTPDMQYPVIQNFQLCIKAASVLVAVYVGLLHKTINFEHDSDMPQALLVIIFNYNIKVIEILVQIISNVSEEHQNTYRGHPDRNETWDTAYSYSICN